MFARKMLDMYLTMEELFHPKLKDITIEQVLKALGDPVRLAAIKELLEAESEEKPCGTFNYSVTKATFSHHLQILREAGVLNMRLEGARKYISIRTKDLNKRFPGLLDFIASSK